MTIRKRTKRLLTCYLLIALAAFSAEAYLRLTAPDPRPRTAFASDGRQSLGSADMHYPAQKQPGHLRVLVIGDSYTWGFNIAQSERFTDVLDAYDPRLEVVTLALPGGNTPMEFDAWKDYGRDVGADIVILAIGIDDNDLGFLERPHVRDVARRVVPGSYLAEWFDERLFYFQTFGKPPFNLALNEHAETHRMWLSILERFRADIEAHGAEAWALVLAPGFFEYEAQTLAASEYAADTAEQARFTTLNFIPVYRDFYGDLNHTQDRWAAPPHDNHYNAETHRVIAAYLWGLLEGELANTESR